MFNSSSREKVYQNILVELNRIVEGDSLRPGDKLPSERELSERLSVGRSSVREALRALELLGLITTRRGEGTFIEHYRHNKLFDILGYYLLRDQKAKSDLIEMRIMLEIDAVKLACKHITEKHIEVMAEAITDAKEKLKQGLIPLEEDFEFHRAIAKASANAVLYRIWLPVVDYSKALWQEQTNHMVYFTTLIEQHQKIFNAIQHRNEEEAVKLLQQHLVQEYGSVM